MQNRLPLRALLLASALSLAGAIPGAWAETPADTLVIAHQIDDIISLDPGQSFEFSGQDVIKNIYDRLVDFDPLDLAAGIKPALAESWEVSEDGKTITLTMRDGVTFHSGNPVRAEDAAWSLQRVVKLNKSPAFILNQFGFTPENVDQQITFEDNRLILKLDQPYAQSYVLNCLAAEVGSVVDKETAMSHAEGEDFGNAWLSTNDAGSGAYSLAAWRPNEAVQLAANADYWQGAPAMKRVIVRHVQESSAQRLLLEQGDIDVARNLTPTDVDGIAGNDKLKVTDELRGRILYMGLNQKDPLLQRPEVIEAMKYLVDYKGIEASFLKGQWKVHQNFLPEGYLGGSDENPWSYDVEKAKQILTDAGITSGKVRTVIRDIREYTDTAQTLQAAMAQAGLTLEIQQMTGAQVLDAYRARQVPIFIGEWGPDYADPNTNASTFAYNPNNADDAGLSQLAWRNAWAVPDEMNKATVAATLEGDTDKRVQMYLDIQKDYREIAPIIPMFQKIEQVASQRNVQHWTSGGSVSSAMYRQVTKE
ncbi:peptide/nickel transport system substrate-binding protein [Paracoccus aminovorans]|uniref:Peptide/nickel transport system substrate-binding protein n=1 Tax=Paracoccus aminovorans TaxID=34004 RepID=A0A1I2ZFR9_9RHOB|nr:ABC transporter substrate-binding protein [Paracoccus aminovorans]CQR86388.1 peptide/nickel transport system, substrate-binding protein [Paracoccus aminovorans]SFH36416.1 peptide/nickel transport system substrate-binding protein [Paracoccus aminovorans]